MKGPGCTCDCGNSKIERLGRLPKRTAISIYLMAIAAVCIVIIHEAWVYIASNRMLSAEAYIMQDREGRKRLSAHSIGDTTFVSLDAPTSKAGVLFVVTENRADLEFRDPNGEIVAVIQGSSHGGRILLHADGQLKQVFPPIEEAEPEH